MNLNKLLRAFSLTELLIVLVVIAVLFAAMAPIMTKRRTGDTTANEPVWTFVSNDDHMDALYDPGVGAYTSTAFFGLDPLDLANNFKPYAKTLIKAKKYQNMLQFRYGSGNGILAGLFSMDDLGNTYMTSRLNGSSQNNYMISGSYNTAAGIGALANAASLNNSVAIGANSMYEPGSNVSRVTSVGSGAGQYIKDSINTFLGANTGRGNSAFPIKSTVAIGSGILGLDESSGNENVFAGYFTGSAGFNSAEAKNNTIIGSQYYGTLQAHDNTIIGYDVYNGGSTSAVHITAAGVGACSSMQYKNDSNMTGNAQGSRTCLGYRSADTRGPSAYPTPRSFETDAYDHIFLGGSAEGFGGRSVLEVHNINSKFDTSNPSKPNMGPTVVLNSNLVVRGNVFFPTVDGVLRSHAVQMIHTRTKSTVAGKDRCGRKCVFGRKKWRDSEACSWLMIIVLAIATAIASAATAGAAGAAMGVIIAAGVVGGAGGGVGGALLDGDGYRRMKDPASFSAISVGSMSGTSYVDSPACAEASVNYPGADTTCPNLGLSDRRLKENITENTDAISKIMLVMPYNYTFKADKNGDPQVGVMAQDLQKYLPDSVTVDENGYLNIRWDEMFYTTINSTKALDSKVGAVTADISNAETDVKDLTSDQRNISKRINALNAKINKLENK